MIEWRKVETGKCRKLTDVPPGAEIEAVNGRECIGNCEMCGGPILDGQKHNRDSEGVMWHAQCRSRYKAVFSELCPVRESTADGVAVGACKYFLMDGTTCPRHGRVREHTAQVEPPGGGRLE